MEVIFHRLARKEQFAVYRRLARESAAKGRRWVHALDHSLARIAANPGIGSPVFGRYRWTQVGRFKYLLFYRQVAADLVVIYAVAHAHRKPGYWLGRVRRA